MPTASSTGSASEEAPAFVVDRIRINGAWHDGPPLANPYGRWPDEALLFGVPDASDDYQQMYHAVIRALEARLDAAGNWRRIPPVEVGARNAPCKEVVLRGDDVVIEQFAWLRNNPADAGRYINITSVFTSDAQFDRNVGTYRCQVRDGTRVSINPEPGQACALRWARPGPRTGRITRRWTIPPWTTGPWTTRATP